MMKHKTSREYAFLMVNYKMPEFIKALQKKIKKEELYIDEDNDDYGLEKESHVTLVPCLDNDVDLDKLKTYLKDISEYDIVITNISKFECDNFDVLKCAVKSENLKKTNKEIKKDFKTHSEYDKYEPHLTIAYMKHGMADKYLTNNLPKLVHLTPTNFHFSYVDKDGNEGDVTFD